MSASQYQFVTANATRLLNLSEDAAELNLQFDELIKLRYKVRQAELLARETQRTSSRKTISKRRLSGRNAIRRRAASHKLAGPGHTF
jgi:hypothetical protein